MGNIKNICVFCASSPHIRQEYKDAAYHLGELLAEPGFRLVTGGGSMGLMASIEDGSLSRGGNVTAIIPQFMIDAGWLHHGIADLRVTDDMAERKKQMIQMADAILILPGGCGTLDEAMEVLTLKQLGLFKAPVIFLNTLGFYEFQLRHLERLAAEGFMSPEYLSMWAVADTPEEAVRLLCELPEWNATMSKLPVSK